MLVKSGTYQKSARGTQALAARDPALTPKLRTILIMVDGKRSVEELARLSAGGGDPGQLLDQLADLGMIEEVAGAASAPAPLASAPAPLASAPAPLGQADSAMPLPDAKRYAVRRLTDLLGPTADDLCMRIESTRTAADFRAVVKRAEAMVREFSGSEAAAAFARDLESHRPA